ncbi:hypothetical protein L1987_40131 [Smallanthus sonchifolius]|uniref:Uncharacterized protein n=1 Tax=Smallanthus sonchifolius TaxID=185202 RepID=A0ACB9GSC6_9ASTR|nr:hypothetical protein L1987_40131 [Smallanthus sonchifolius]
MVTGLPHSRIHRLASRMMRPYLHYNKGFRVLQLHEVGFAADAAMEVTEVIRVAEPEFFKAATFLVANSFERLVGIVSLKEAQLL